MVTRRAPILPRCDICDHPQGRYYAVFDRLLHLCPDCWQWDTRNQLSPPLEVPCQTCPPQP